MLIFFAEKMWVAFAFAKATHIFSAKNTCELFWIANDAKFLYAYNEDWSYYAYVQAYLILC